jgi:hypothetical protein
LDAELSCTFADMLVRLIPLQRQIKKDGRRNAFDDLILLIVGHNFVLLFLQQEFSWFPDFPNLAFALKRRVPVVCNQSRGADEDGISRGRRTSSTSAVLRRWK